MHWGVYSAAQIQHCEPDWLILCRTWKLCFALLLSPIQDSDEKSLVPQTPSLRPLFLPHLKLWLCHFYTSCLYRAIVQRIISRLRSQEQWSYKPAIPQTSRFLSSSMEDSAKAWKTLAKKSKPHRHAGVLSAFRMWKPHVVRIIFVNQLPIFTSRIECTRDNQRVPASEPILDKHNHSLDIRNQSGLQEEKMQCFSSQAITLKQYSLNMDICEVGLCSWKATGKNQLSFSA